MMTTSSTTTTTTTPSPAAAAARFAAHCLLLHHHALSGHALAASGYPTTIRHVIRRCWTQPTTACAAPLPEVTTHRHNRRRRSRYASTPPSRAQQYMLAAAIADVDEFDGSSAVEGVSVEPNLLTGAEIDLPSNIEIESMSIRGGAADAAESSKSASTAATATATASKRAMMAFALPALGIFLVNPLLSNIDNAFVGRTVGSVGLAALSPATLCTDQVLYLFSFLARATTGLVSRAYATGGGANADGAREAASAPLTVSIIIGLVLSGLYAVFTPTLLGRMQVDPTLIPRAASYVYWRGAVAWAALAQACCLQILLATRDATTPLKIVSTAAVLNVVGDYVFCCNPLRWGCAGAAAATSVATLLSSTLMVRALRTKGLLPTLRLPTRREVGSLVEFMGPLMMITITRLLGFVYMQRSASRLGDLKSLAAFQICTNIVSFFLLFGEPLSQLSQTKLPALVDREDGEGLLANLKSVLTLGLGASVLVGGAAFLVARFLTGIFTADPAVQAIAHSAAPSVFFMVANAIMAVTVDGAMLASKDFGWMLFLGISTFLAQLGALKNATNLNAVFATFIFRLGVYGPLCLARAAMGKGAIGKAIAKTWKEKKNAAPKGEKSE